jgi:pyruvate formate lyase activating enzyme
MGVGHVGYCGLRWNDSGRLVSLSTPKRGLYYAYLDSHVTNCCAAWFCPGGTGCGYPKFAYSKGPEYGYYSLAIFFYGCNFNCLFCQNPSHKEIHTAASHSADELVNMTLENGKISCWCFFGGSPEPQLPFAINASRKVLDAIGSKRILRICFESNGCGNPLLERRAARIAYETGGNVKFDLKTWNDDLSLALSGVSNRAAYENFKTIAEDLKSAQGHPPSLCATTLLVPGYVDEIEVENISKFIAHFDSEIPYELLIFHPDFMMLDLPVTPLEQAKRCYLSAKRHLKHVYVGNLNTLGIRSMQEFERHCMA